MDPRKNVMSELQREKNKLLQGQPMPPRGQAAFPGRVSHFKFTIVKPRQNNFSFPKK